MLHCNFVSHWLSPYPEWSLQCKQIGIRQGYLLPPLCTLAQSLYCTHIRWGQTVQTNLPQGIRYEAMTNKKSLKLCLTHWHQVIHICVSKRTSIGSDNGLSPGWRQAIIWTNAGILLIGPSGTNFSEILIEMQTFSLQKIHLKMPSAKCRPFCLGLNVKT